MWGTEVTEGKRKQGARRGKEAMLDDVKGPSALKNHTGTPLMVCLATRRWRKVWRSNVDAGLNLQGTLT
jgi:hypothetical protein